MHHIYIFVHIKTYALGSTFNHSCFGDSKPAVPNSGGSCTMLNKYINI